uniref:Ig-like domain-containing protein n=1 Tax=Esox lucius TaxID=8010 RepID=A0A3P8Z3I6_ESOLU
MCFYRTLSKCTHELLFFYISGTSVEQSMNPDREVVDVMESKSVKLSCRYNSSSVSNTVSWYHQHPGSSPQLLIMEYSDSTKWTLTHDKEKKRVDLMISSVEVTDSALYYCALQPTVTGNIHSLNKNINIIDNR